MIEKASELDFFNNNNCLKKMKSKITFKKALMITIVLISTLVFGMALTYNKNLPQADVIQISQSDTEVSKVSFDKIMRSYQAEAYAKQMIRNMATHEPQYLTDDFSIAAFNNYQNYINTQANSKVKVLEILDLEQISSKSEKDSVVVSLRYSTTSSNSGIVIKNLQLTLKNQDTTGNWYIDEISEVKS